MKSLKFELTPQLIDYKYAIRNKGNIINLLISISRFLNTGNLDEFRYLKGEIHSNQVLLVIHIDKMSRVFIIEENKIHTFQYPFKIYDSDEILKIMFNNILIDSSVLSILSSVFQDFDEQMSFEIILEKYWDIIADFNIAENESKSMETLITFLLTFEAGYLRFDYDEIRCSENHPKNHFDFYYSSNNTFKIGLNERIEHEKMIEILDINKKSATIKI